MIPQLKITHQPGWIDVELGSSLVWQFDNNCFRDSSSHNNERIITLVRAHLENPSATVKDLRDIAGLE